MTELSHYVAGYDPAYAHAYYLRTRKLKGRKPGKGAQAKAATFSPSAKPATAPKTVSVKLANGKTLNLNSQQLDDAQAHAAVRVGQLKTTLSKLQTQLQQAKAKANQTAKGKKPATAADKAKAKQAAKNYRQSHKQALKNKAKAAPKTSATAAPKPKTDTVATLQSKISKVKGALAVAVALQTSLASATKHG